MKTFRIAALALAVSGVFATGAKAASSTNDWWDVTFDDKLAEYMPDDSATAMIVLTQRLNLAASPQTFQTWDSGIWYTEDGDETTVTNQFNPTNLNDKAYGNTTCLKLDTQGNDLTWRVDQTNTMADSRTALVDADLYLVGSDSPPDAADFDGTGDVQAAVYLKNETDEDTGETTNSVLCVYVWDSNANGGNGGNVWQELKGVELHDNSWASVKVVVDHAKIVDPQNNYPVVQVFVNGVMMTARDGDDDHWTAANADTAQTAGRVSSVAFRGTGAVDNFVGKTVDTSFDSYNFTAQVFMDGTNVLATGTEGNVTRTVYAEAGSGKIAKFEDFIVSDYDYEFEQHEATWALNKVVVVDQGTGAETTYNYEWDGYNAICLEGDNPAIDIDTATGQFGDYQTGLFDAIPSTAGATKDGTIIKIYFKTLGAIDVNGLSKVGDDVIDTQTANYVAGQIPANETHDFTFPESRNGYVLRGISAPGATADYDGSQVVVTVPIDPAWAVDTNVVVATYVAGDYTGMAKEFTTNAAGAWTLDGGIAKIGAQMYPSFRAAVAAAAESADETVTIQLVADDRVSFSATDTEIAIGRALVVEGNGHTIYGVTDYAYDGVNDHDIFIGSAAGDVTFKNVKISEFGDSVAGLEYRTYPIWTSQAYAGTLTLDGVTVEKYARTAINLNAGKFLITNCVISGRHATAEGTHFVDGIQVLNATGTVVDTTIAGVGCGDGKYAGACFTLNTDGAGSIEVLSGDYTGEAIATANLGVTGTIEIKGGIFVSTAAEGEDAFEIDDAENSTAKIVISGGWFDRAPGNAFLKTAYSAYEDAGNSPDPDRVTWTVGVRAVEIEGVAGETFFTIAQARAYARDPEHEVENPVYVLLAELPEETVNLLTGDTLVVKFDDETFVANLTVSTTVSGKSVTHEDATEGGVTTRTYSLEDSGVEPIAVTIGGDTDNPLPAGTEPITVDATDGFTLRFAAKQTGVTYILQSAATVDGAFADVTVNGTPVSVTPQAVDDVVVLTDPDVQSTVKFFRVKVVVAP